jgi:hypothetical protein
MNATSRAIIQRWTRATEPAEKPPQPLGDAAGEQHRDHPHRDQGRQRAEPKRMAGASESSGSAELPTTAATSR